MRVAAVGIVRGRRDASGSAGLDIESLYGLIEGSLEMVPRLRQRLAHVPLLAHPVWIDDDRFDLRYHVRHVALPSPGDVEILRQVVGQLLSSPLDRGKPMWEAWMVSGLGDTDTALVIKAHHCVVDALSGIALFSSLVIPATKNPQLWRPRAKPHGARLLYLELAHRFSWIAALIRALPRVMTDPRGIGRNIREVVLAIVEAARGGLTPATKTSLNRPVGPSRSLDWWRVDIAQVDMIRARFDGTLNDVVLATVAGAVGRFLRGRGAGQPLGKLPRPDPRSMSPTPNDACEERWRQPAGSKPAG